jgi:hypothetical protein
VKTIILGKALYPFSKIADSLDVAYGYDEGGVRIYLKGSVPSELLVQDLTLEQLQARLAGTEAPQPDTTLPQWKPNPGHEPDDIKRADGSCKGGLVLFKDGCSGNLHRQWNWALNDDSRGITHYMILED